MKCPILTYSVLGKHLFVILIELSKGIDELTLFLKSY